MIPAWMHPHWNAVDDAPAPDTKVLDALSLDQFGEMISKAAQNNSDLRNDAIRRADSYSFGVVHPEVIQSAKNIKLIDHWLASRGVEWPEYADFDAAVTALKAGNLLELDQAELARDNTRRTYKGALTCKTYSNVDDLILAERQHALNNLPKQSAEEIALESLPQDQALALLKECERQEQLKVSRAEVGKNADAFLIVAPWWVDTKRNGHLLRMELEAAGYSPDTATIEQMRECAEKLRADGLVTVNQKAVAKEHAAELQQRADGAVKRQQAAEMSEQEMYDLPMEELRRRANGNYSGVGI